MAKLSSVKKNERRKMLIEKYRVKREKLKAIIYDGNAPAEDRFLAVGKLDKLPRNSSAVRYRNRCAFSGRPRGFYRFFGLSRIALRDFASIGQIPGVTKSSW